MLTKAKYWREFTALPERLPAYLPAPGDAPHWTVTIFYKGSDPGSGVGDGALIGGDPGQTRRAGRHAPAA